MSDLRASRILMHRAIWLRQDAAVRTIRCASTSDANACRSIAATLPEHFAAADLDAIERDAQEHACWFAELDGGPAAFVIIERRSRLVAEILWMATAEKSRRQGLGTALLEHVVGALSCDGVQLIEVKTLDASTGYEPYESTHAFWRKHGFVQVDTIDPLPGWRAGNPAALYVAALTATR